MMQTRRQSMIETAASVAIGYLAALASQLAIFPLFGVYLPMGDNLVIGLLFTVVSLVRSYFLRRLFNRLRDFF